MDRLNRDDDGDDDGDHDDADGYDDDCDDDRDDDADGVYDDDGGDDEYWSLDEYCLLDACGSLVKCCSDVCHTYNARRGYPRSDLHTAPSHSD